MAKDSTKKKKISGTKLKAQFKQLSDAEGKSFLPAFSAFPPDVKFDMQDEEEEIVLVIRQHWSFFVSYVFRAVFIFILALAFGYLFDFANIGVSTTFKMGVTLLGLLISLTSLATAFFKWYFSVNIVTDERILDIDFVQIFSHRVSETQLERIEDVSHSTTGFWATIFDYGTVYIQTAGEQREFEFQNVPRPRDVQETITDLLEMKQNAKS